MVMECCRYDIPYSFPLHPIPLFRSRILRYVAVMTIVSIKDVQERLAELAGIVGTGQTVTVVENGKPLFDLVPHAPAEGLRLDAIAEFKRKYEVDEVFSDVAEDFDAPLPEDVLLKPLP